MFLMETLFIIFDRTKYMLFDKNLLVVILPIILKETPKRIGLESD